MLGQILILHNSQNLSFLSTSSQISNNKKTNYTHWQCQWKSSTLNFLCVHLHELYLYSNFTVAWKANIFENIHSIIKIERIPRSFSNLQGQPWKRQGWRNWCCKHKNSAFDWHNEVRKKCFGEVSKHCNYFWLSGLTGCSLNIQEFTILTFTITT